MEPGFNVPPEWAEELATAGEEERKLGFPLNKVTVWFPCPECGGYVHSIPALQEHCRLDHDLPYVNIPKNCPQWAKDGKICFTYQPYNWGRGAKQKVSSEATKEKKEGQIRIRNPSELMEKNSEEDVETSPNNQRMEPRRSDYVRNHSTNMGRVSSPPRVHSPPDSGMFDGGSEVVEDELPQQNKALKPNSGNSGGLRMEDLTHVDDKTKGQEMGSRSNKDESKATTCSTCGKRFKTVAVLKAHCKKVHKKDTSSQQTLLSSSKQPQSKPTTPEEDSEDSSSDDEMNNRERPRARSRRRINSSSSKSSPSSSATCSPEKVKSTKAAVRGRSRGRATKRIPNYERDPDWGGLRRSSRNSSQVKRKRSSSPLSSNDYSESDEDPYKKKRRRRSLRKSTSASRTSRASKAPSSKSSSTSSNSNTDSDNSSTHYSGSSSSEDEGELTDRSTTPEVQASQEKQSTEEERLSPEKEAPPQEPMVNANDGTSDSDSSDIFIAVMVTKKRTSSSGKNTVVIKQEADGPTDESSRRSTTVCNKCNLECHDTGELLAHIAKEHHKDTPEQIYLVCGYCQKRFSNKNKSGFNRHIKTHKKDESEADQ